MAATGKSVTRRALLYGGAAAVVVGGGLAAGSFATMGGSEEYAKATAAMRPKLPANADIRDIVRQATLAANGHNTQPWRFKVAETSISILPDLTRRTPVVDPDDHHLYANLGCAAANLALAAAATGRPGEVRFDPAGDGALVFDFAAGSPSPSELTDAIPQRLSTRAPFDGRPVSTADLARLESAGAAPGVQLFLVTDIPQRNRIRDLIVAGNTIQMGDPAFVAELKEWLRFNPAAALASGDGLFSGSSGNPSLPTWLGKLMFNLTVSAASENEKYVKQLDSSAGVAVFFGDKADPEHWTRVGQACQRFALQATALGLKHSFVNQPVEVPSVRPELAALLGVPGKRPDIVMRFGYGPDVPMSPRRPVEAVLVG